MSVNTGNNNSNTLGAAIDDARRPQQQQPSGQSTFQQEVQPAFDGSLLPNRAISRRRPVSRAGNGEALRAFTKAYEKALESMDSEERKFFTMLPMDSQANMTTFSNLAVVLRGSHEGRQAAAVYLFTLEASGRKLDSRTITMGNRQVTIEQVPSDTVDAVLRDKVIAQVQSKFGLGADQIIEVGVMTIPTEFNVESEDGMQELLYRSTQALWTAFDLKVLRNDTPINAAEIVNDYKLSTVLSYGNEDVTNSVGLPVRSDVSVTLKGTLKVANAQNSAAAASHEQSTDLTRVDAYIDLAYRLPDGYNPMTANLGNMAQATQRWIQRIVVTKLDTEQDSITLEQQMLGIHSVGSLTQNGASLGVYRLQNIADRRDLNDIGALGLELNPKNPMRIPTKDGTFGDQQLAELAAMAFHHERYELAIDVAEADEQTWVNRVFVQASDVAGDPKLAAAANQAILTAADRLFNGQLSQFWTPGQPAILPGSLRIHLGYYIGDNDRKRDIRCVSAYVPMLNLYGEKDMNVVFNFDSSMDVNTNAPVEVQTEERGNILRGIEPSYKLKSFARRVFVNPALLLAMRQASIACGMVIQPDRIHSIFGNGQQRGMYHQGPNASFSGSDISAGFQFAAPTWGNQRNGVGNSGFGGLY